MGALTSLFPLKALAASRRLIVLHPCPFVRLVMANNATYRCAKDAVMTSKMARSAADHRSFQAALCVRGGNGSQGKESGGATHNRFHLSLQCTYENPRRRRWFQHACPCSNVGIREAR